MIKKFTEKPKVVEAIQYDGTPESLQKVKEFVGKIAHRSIVLEYDDGRIFILGSYLKPTDYVFKDSKDAWVVSANEIDKYYKPVEDEIHHSTP
jgi:hypothetical protein